MKDFKIRLLKSFSCTLTITSPPLKEVRELAQRSMCGDVSKGGMLQTDKLN